MEPSDQGAFKEGKGKPLVECGPCRACSVACFLRPLCLPLLCRPLPWSLYCVAHCPGPSACVSPTALVPLLVCHPLPWSLCLCVTLCPGPSACVSPTVLAPLVIQIEVPSGIQCKCIVAHKNQLWIGKTWYWGLTAFLSDE